MSWPTHYVSQHGFSETFTFNVTGTQATQKAVLLSLDAGHGIEIKQWDIVDLLE